MISVIVPTLASRWRSFTRIEDAYRDCATMPYEIVLVRDKPAWGEALNVGAELSEGDWLFFTCDDMLPYPGWDQAAVAAVQDDLLPAPTIEMPSGEVYIDEMRHPTKEPLIVLPFCARESFDGSLGIEDALGPILNTHYFADNAFTDRARYHHHPIVFPPEFRFRHLQETAGQRDQQAQLRHDIEIYNAAIRFAGLAPSTPMPRL